MHCALDVALVHEDAANGGGRICRGDRIDERAHSRVYAVSNDLGAGQITGNDERSIVRVAVAAVEALHSALHQLLKLLCGQRPWRWLEAGVKLAASKKLD